MKLPLLVLFMAALLTAAPAAAAEFFGGVLVHDVKSPITKSPVEGGLDVQAGWRGDRIAGTPLQPYALVSAHTQGKTHFAAVGVSAKFGDRIFIRPGLGLAVHTGSTGEFEDPANDRKEFGSRVLLAPELGIGARLNNRMTVEATWLHLSHAQLGSRQNPGMDSIGLRLSIALR